MDFRIKMLVRFLVGSKGMHMSEENAINLTAFEIVITKQFFKICTVRRRLKVDDEISFKNF